ncbi:MAG: peptidylprolyl isomerase [Kiritimatiellae bacterium]|nr:peptidylprolyl isomerase [Kiritimatiellia bacterium]
MAIKVNGIEISADAVEQETARLKPDYERYITANGGEPDDVQLREWATENLVEKELLRQEAVRSQDEPDEKKVAAWLEENRAVFGDELSGEEQRVRCAEDIKIRSLVKSVRKSVPRPTDAELQHEYDKNPERFTVPESLRVAHICRVLYPGVDKARSYIDLLDLKKRVENLEIEWTEAVQLSETFHRDFGIFDTVMRGMLPMEIEEKLFSLERGQITDVIELESGTLHLFKVLVKREPELIPFADVREELSSLMFAEAAENALNEMLDALKAKAAISTTK